MRCVCACGISGRAHLPGLYVQPPMKTHITQECPHYPDSLSKAICVSKPLCSGAEQVCMVQVNYSLSTTAPQSSRGCTLCRCVCYNGNDA